MEDTMTCKKCGQYKEGQSDRPYVNYCKDCYPKKIFTCITCGETKDISEKSKGKHYCKKCTNAYKRERRRKIKEGTWVPYQYNKQEGN